MTFKTIIEGFAAAVLVLLLRVWPLLSPRHSAFYHNFLPIQSLVWGIVIDLIVFTLLLAILFKFLEKSAAGPRTVIWAFVLAAVVPVLIEDVAAVRQTSLSPHQFKILFFGSLFLLLGCAAVAARSLPTGGQGIPFRVAAGGVRPGVDVP